MKNVLEFFEQGALINSPEKTAVTCSNRTVTFRELKSKANIVANYLTHYLKLKNVPVAVFMPKCEETIVSNLGILYSGNIYMNLDTNSPIERTRNIVNHIKPEVLITSKKYMDILKKEDFFTKNILNIDEILQLVNEANTAWMFEENYEYLNTIDTDPVCIINTSGSTGIPKGVALSHKGIIDFITQITKVLNLNEKIRMGSLSPFYFDIYILELFVSLFKGADLIILPESLAAFPVKLLEEIQANQINFIFWVPTIMVNISNLDLFSKYNMHNLEYILFAGEVFPTKHFNYWKRNIPEATFINMYGPIETTVDCLFHMVERSYEDDEVLPIGKAFDNTNFFLLNENGQEVSEGEIGELYIQGSSLALGYWNDWERTKKAFVQNPLHMNYPDLLYKTGDLVKLNSHGEVVFIGRKDFQIKHLGYRIELGEIENVTLNIKGIKNTCVIYNKTQKEIVLFYESAKDMNSKELRIELSRLLPKYMIPTKYISLEQLPRNANGKIDRKGLESLW